MSAYITKLLKERFSPSTSPKMHINSEFYLKSLNIQTYMANTDANHLQKKFEYVHLIFTKIIKYYSTKNCKQINKN